MDRQDMYLGINCVSTQYIEEAEVITCLKSKQRNFAFSAYLLGALLMMVHFLLDQPVLGLAGCLLILYRHVRALVSGILNSGCQ